MNAKFPNPDEQRLADALRREAEESAPAFSEPLHDRIMRQVTRSAAPAVPVRRIVLWPWITAAAAAILILATWIGMTHSFAPAPIPRSVQVVVKNQEPPTAPAVPSLDRLLDQAGSNIQENQMAYLDQDARDLADFVLDQLTVNPAQSSRAPQNNRAF